MAGLALEPTSTATAIRGGVVTDGPFVESKEAIAGVFVIEARDLDHAIALARLTPIMDGGVEVRPLLGFEVVEGADRRGRAGGRRRAPSRVGLRARRDGARHARPRRRRGGVQEAYVAALTAWARDGVPERPGAWLTTAARRNALNAVKRRQVLQAKLPLLIEPEGEEEPDMEPDVIPDDRLRLVFTCCHPALAQEAQVALTLRLVCGVSTGDIAQAFLVSEPTMAARLTRAKKKIAAARIPYAVPGAAELPARLDAVLSVIHLLYTTGHTAPSGGALMREDLAVRALDLARMLRELLDAPEVLGLLALLIVNHARRARARTPAGSRCGWPSRTGAPGTARRSRRATGSWSPRSRPARRAASPCRPRSRRCTRRRPATRRPTGRRS